MQKAIRILGIDPGLRRTGWGVVETVGTTLRFVASGTVTSEDKAPLATRLCQLHDGLTAVLEAQQPDEAAVEATFVNRDATATLTESTSPHCPGSAVFVIFQCVSLTCRSRMRPFSARWNSVAVRPCLDTDSVRMYSDCTGPSPGGGAYCSGNPGGFSSTLRNHTSATTPSSTASAPTPSAPLTDWPSTRSQA